MVNKFKAGDKIINEHDTVWIITTIDNGYMAGVILKHNNKKLVGRTDCVRVLSSITWMLLDKHIMLNPSPSFALGDLVEDRYNHNLEMIVTKVQSGGITCVDLINAGEHVYDPEDLRHSEGVVLSNSKQYQD